MVIHEIEDLEKIIVLMKREGVAHVRVGDVEVTLGHQAPRLAPMTEEEADAEAAKEAHPRRSIYDEPDLWPGGRVPRLHRPPSPEDDAA